MPNAARCLAALAALLVLPASEAMAQHPQTRDGFWIGFGFGYGSADATCDRCTRADRLGGVSAFLKLGGTRSQHLLLGAAVNAWTKQSGGAIEALGTATASVYYYPWPATGLYLTGGLGLSEYLLGVAPRSRIPSVTGSGWGFAAGLGYDIRIGRNVSLSPAANFFYGGLGKLNAGGSTSATGWKQNVFDVGLGLTFH